MKKSGKEVYRGEFRGGKYEGYGHAKFPNNNEYDGEWKNFTKHGQGIYKEAATGEIRKIIS